MKKKMLKMKPLSRVLSVLVTAAAFAAALTGCSGSLVDPAAAPGIEIGVWCPPPAAGSAEETNRRYRDLAETGVSFAWNVPTEALDACAASGVGALVHLPATRDERDNTAACLEFVAGIKDHPAVIGFNIMDEPSATFFKKIAAIREAVESELSDGRYAVCNLYPDYASAWQLSGPMPEGTPNIVDWEIENLVDYEQHVERYMSLVNPKMLSFDYYPLQSGGTSDKGFMRNMRLIADAAKKSGVPFHGFVQAISWNGHRKPTLQEYRWLVHSHLIHGAKSFSYFYYWAPYADGGPEGFSSAPVEYGGEKTELYDYMQTVNKEIRAMSPAVLQFEHKGFIAANFSEDDLYFMGLDDSLPAFGSVTEITAAAQSERILTGCFEKNGLAGYYVMNYSFEQEASAVLRFERSCRYEIWDKTGLAASGRAEKAEIRLGAGEAAFVVVK